MCSLDYLSLLGFLAVRPVGLADSDALNQDLTLRPVPIGRIAGRLTAYDEKPIDGLDFSYQLPDGGDPIRIGPCTTKGDFDCEVPDLSVLGGQYCVSTLDPYDRFEASTCGVRIGMKDLRLDVQAPPKIVEPKDKTSMTQGSRIAWTGVKGSIYQLLARPYVLADGGSGCTHPRSLAPPIRTRNRMQTARSPAHGCRCDRPPLDR